MKKTIKLIGIAVLAAVIGFSMIACGEDPGGGDPRTVTYSGTTSNGDLYSLKIIENINNPNRAVLDDPMEGDNFELTWTASNNSRKKSTGTIKSVNGNEFIMLPSKAETPNTTFTTTIGDNGLTDVTGLITFDDGSKSEEVDEPLTPVTSAVSWTGLTANGKANSATTTALTLTFDKNPDTLTIKNITITGATKGTLTGSGKTRTLKISNITVAQGEGEYVTVTLTNPAGYTITPSSRTVTINKAYSTGTWTAVSGSPFGTTKINAVAYGNGRWVAVGEEGKMAYSSDGATWTAVADSPFQNYTLGKSTTYTVAINAVAYGSNKFVAGGGRGRMAYSSDGTIWTAIIEEEGEFTITDIAWDGNRFVTVGTRAGIAISTDGTSWTPVDVTDIFPRGSGGDIKAIGWGDNRLVAVIRNGEMWTSTNGTSWTTVDTSGNGVRLGSGGSYMDIAWGGNRWVAVGYAGNAATSVIGTSANGTTWTAGDRKATNLSGILAIAYGSNRFVAGDNEGKTAMSTDGATWTATADGILGEYQNSNGKTVRAQIIGIAWGGNKFIAVGQNGKMAYWQP